MPASTRAIELTLAAASSAADMKSTNIVALDVTSALPLADVFLIASGNSERQVSAIADRIERDLLVQGFKAVRKEGVRQGRWALLDFNDLIVHIMHHEDRGYYELERLWKDCPVVELPEVVTAD